MGFLKRFLSLGSSKSKKNKKKQIPTHTKDVDAEGRILPRELVHQDPDTSMNRLLRSSSTKFSVMSAIDYASLPPLPLPTGAGPSTPSLSPSPSMLTVATTPGVQRSGTYVVKVHGRTTHSRTEFPRANPPPSPTKQRKAAETKTPQQDRHDQHDDNDNDPDHDEPGPRIKEVNFTPKDNSRIYALRQDPSVVSLLNMYDDQGCLDVHAFASTPPTPAPLVTECEGRQPRPRTGSTLRQLLGEPQPAFMTNNTTEGDISWAERFLDEQLDDDSPLSSPSSIALETPRDALFPDNLSVPLVAPGETTFSSIDVDSSINHPAISSMEVEVSGSEEDVLPDVAPVEKPKPAIEPKTPQRASEVFGFLNRRNTVTVKERDLPELPQDQHLDNTRTNDEDRPHDVGTENTSIEPALAHDDATHSANTSHSESNTSSDTPSNFSHAQIHTATMTKLSSAFASSTLSLNLLVSNTEDFPNQTTELHTSGHILADDTDERQPCTSSAPLKAIPTSATDWSAATTTCAAHHNTGSSASSGGSSRLPPSRIPRGPRPRPLSSSKREELQLSAPKISTAPSSDDDHHIAKVFRATSHSTHREAFTSIPQRQHRRVTPRSSEVSSDHEPRSAVDNLKLSDSTIPYLRKRSTKPEHLSRARTFDKENTPSPPRRAGTSTALGFATPVRARTLVGHLLEREDAQAPPSPASSSELSPVAQDMMNNLRKQRMRARQVERRRGVWMRD